MWYRCVSSSPPSLWDSWGFFWGAGYPHGSQQSADLVTQPEIVRADAIREHPMPDLMGMGHAGAMFTCTLVAFDEMDLLDAGGPYEVLLTASRLLDRDGHDGALDIVTAGIHPGIVHAYGGLGLEVTTALADVAHTDILIVPGAINTTLLTGDVELIGQVARLAADATVTLSVCTGAFMLAAAGLLVGRPWTTHHEDIDALARILGPDLARPGAQWVDSGQIVTAAGLSTGIAGALHVVDRLFGSELAERTAEQIEYDWAPTATTRL